MPQTQNFGQALGGSPAHNLHNPNTEDLVYLVGGNRCPFDVCDYPKAGKRRYRINGNNVYVDAEVLEKAGGLQPPSGR